MLSLIIPVFYKNADSFIYKRALELFMYSIFINIIVIHWQFQVISFQFIAFEVDNPINDTVNL